MKTLKKGFINIQLFGEPDGATTPDTSTSSETTPSVNYEQEYRKLQIELEKQKKLKDDYAKESAGYKKQLAEKMTDDEKNAQAQKEFADRMAALEAENKSMKLEKELLANGFTSEESEKLIKENFSVKAISEIVKLKVEEARKSAKAEGLRGSTPDSPVGNGTAKGDSKSDFQKYQEAKLNTSNEVKLK